STSAMPCRRADVDVGVPCGVYPAHRLGAVYFALRLAAFFAPAFFGAARFLLFDALSFRWAASSMIPRSMALAWLFPSGLCDFQIAGWFAPRMSAKSPKLLTLLGAASVMSISPAQSSRCLMSSH